MDTGAREVVNLSRQTITTQPLLIHFLNYEYL